MKDLWKMENALNYLSTTNNEYQYPNDAELFQKEMKVESNQDDVKALINVSSKRK